MKKHNLFLMIFSALMLIWCIAIKLTAGIMNIGTLTLFGISLVLLLLGIFNGKYKEFRVKAREKKAGKVLYGILDGALILVLLTILVESNCMLTAILNTPESDSTLIVLGSKVNTDGPSDMTCLRLDAACEYLNDHPDSKCVLSGGQGSNEPWSEAEGMAKYLIEKGIDEDRLYLEDKSTSTRENLQYSMELIEEKGLNKNVTIVTNAFHVYRAGRIAKREGMEFTVLPAKSVYGIFPSYYIRELYAILADWVVYS